MVATVSAECARHKKVGMIWTRICYVNHEQGVPVDRNSTFATMLKG